MQAACTSLLNNTCRRHPLRFGFARKPSVQNDNNSCCEAAHHWNFDSTGHDVLCECALLLFFFGANHVHSTSSRPRPACHTLRSKNTRGWSPNKNCQITATDQPNFYIPQHKEFGTNTRGRSATQGISPSDESENSTSHSAASTAPRAFASTYEKAATPRQPPL